MGKEFLKRKGFEGLNSLFKKSSLGVDETDRGL